MNCLFPNSPESQELKNAKAIDIREPHERIGATESILALTNVPQAEWHTIPARFPERPLVLCCAAGIRTRICLELLNHPEGIHAWAGTVQQWVDEG